MADAQETAKCAYCGEVRPLAEMHEGTIWVRRDKRVVQEKHWYCRGKPCHGYHQMAQEG